MLSQLQLFTSVFGDLKYCMRHLPGISDWYHGWVSTQEAQDKLRGQPEGTFLLRLRKFSLDDAVLAVSVQTQLQAVQTFSILNDAKSERYVITDAEGVPGATQYATIKQAVEAHPSCKVPLLATHAKGKEEATSQQHQRYRERNQGGVGVASSGQCRCGLHMKSHWIRCPSCLTCACGERTLAKWKICPVCSQQFHRYMFVL